MHLILNSFQKNEVEGIANIIRLLENKNIVCTIAWRRNICSFRVFRGKPDDIRWTSEGLKDANTRNIDASIISWASPEKYELGSGGELLLEILGENMSTLLEICYQFVSGLREQKNGIVTFWS